MKAHSHAAVISAIVAGLSACSGSNDAGSGGGGGGQIASIPQLTNGFLPVSMRASLSGMALSMISLSDGYEIVTSTPSGVVSTALTIPFGAGILTDMVLDGKTVYLIGILSGSTDGLYSVPLGGGTPTQVLLADSTQGFRSLAVDADNVYLGVKTQGSAGGASSSDSILQVAKATGTATSIYAAPAGQTIQYMAVDGTSIYWTETDLSIDQGPATVRSASLAGGGTLAPVQLGVLPSPAGVAQLVATNGVAFVANLTTGSPSSVDGGITVTVGDASITVGVGDYAFTAGGNGQPIPVSGGSVPIAANPGIFYYNDTPGLAKVTVEANGVSGATTIAAGVYATQMAADGAGSLYYVVYGKAALHKVQ